jgi:hypothetical protein
VLFLESCDQHGSHLLCLPVGELGSILEGNGLNGFKPHNRNPLQASFPEHSSLCSGPVPFCGVLWQETL